MQYFPLFMDLKNRPVLVVGGGEVATRKVEALLRAQASVTMVSPELSETLHRLYSEGKCIWVEGEYQKSLMGPEYVQIWATTDNTELNHQVYKDGKELNILVNVVDDTPYCDFITPSMINRGKIQVALSSGGASPVLIRNLRERIESQLPQNLSLLADFAGAKRDEVKQKFHSVAERRVFWEHFFSLKELELADSKEKISELFYAQLEHKYRVTMSQIYIEYGHDVELLSLKSLRLMQKAELVLHPKDCPFDFIDLCRRDAERREYYSVHDLQDKIQKAEIDDVSSICVFVPKGAESADSELREVIAGNPLLKVVG